MPSLLKHLFRRGRQLKVMAPQKTKEQGVAPTASSIFKTALSLCAGLLQVRDESFLPLLQSGDDFFFFRFSVADFKPQPVPLCSGEVPLFKRYAGNVDLFVDVMVKNDSFDTDGLQIVRN